ncbi:sodium-coupled monocarboxylate transporter 2-like, partial [Mizuhopecten yessoensis]|uniref:sodium-coupled monocarboxylate transporter 2-like n=1 Tax=Mizuhopecten yessoensis TaxID=6573 RepID=UPI000B45755E
FNADPIVRHSVWSCVFGGAITWLAVYGANQAQIQRAITCPTLRKAQIAYWVNFPGLCIILYLCCFIGTVTYAFYRTCDPKTFGLISAADQLFPLFVMDVLGKMPGIPGIFVSCIFSGALSTLSSGLNSIAAVLLEDVVKVFCIADIDERRATNVSRLIALVSGFICLGLTYVASMLGGVLQAALALFGMLGGPILGVFTLGIIFPWANQKGALTAVSSGLVFMLWIGVGYQVHKPPVSAFSTTNLTGCNWNLTHVQSYTNFTQPFDVLGNTTAPEYLTWDPFVRLYSLSYLWYSATAMLYVVSVGLIVSLATGRTDPKSIDPKLMCPIFDVFMPFLPEKIRKPLRLGVDYSKMKEPAEEATGDEVEVFMDKSGQEMMADVNGIPS